MKRSEPDCGLPFKRGMIADESRRWAINRLAVGVYGLVRNLPHQLLEKNVYQLVEQNPLP